MARNNQNWGLSQQNKAIKRINEMNNFLRKSIGLTNPHSNYLKSRIYKLAKSEMKIRKDTERIIGHPLKTCFPPNQKNLKEMDNFLYRYHLP